MKLLDESEIKINVYVRRDEYTVQMHAKLDRDTYRKLMQLLTELHADVVSG